MLIEEKLRGGEPAGRWARVKAWKTRKPRSEAKEQRLASRASKPVSRSPDGIVRREKESGKWRAALTK
jgi:hypothetical protein